MEVSVDFEALEIAWRVLKETTMGEQENGKLNEKGFRTSRYRTYEGQNGGKFKFAFAGDM